jgi:hypothetical protein
MDTAIFQQMADTATMDPAERAKLAHEDGLENLRTAHARGPADLHLNLACNMACRLLPQMVEHIEQFNRDLKEAGIRAEVIDQDVTIAVLSAAYAFAFAHNTTTIDKLAAANGFKLALIAAEKIVGPAVLQHYGMDAPK